MSETQKEKQWYVIRAIGGKENKVKEYLEAEIRRGHLEEYISQVLIPTEKVYTIRNGKKVSKERVSNPGIDPEKASFMVSDNSPAYIPAGKTSTVDGLLFLKSLNAITILAHPTLIKNYREEIMELGFDGIEARYPDNLEGEEEYFINYAKEHGMFISAGSDYHGDIKHAMIGTSTLNEEEFLPIKKLLEI